MRLRVGKILRGFGRFLLGLVVLLGVVWLLRVPLFGGLVKDAVTSRLHDALGGRYAIDAVGGNWFTEVRLEGLKTVEPPPDGPLTGLSVREASVGYDLVGLLGGAPLGALDSVRVEGARLELDTTRSSMKVDVGEPSDLQTFESFRGTVDLELEVAVQTGEGMASVSGLRIALGEDRTLQVDVGEIALPDHFDVRGPVAGRVERVHDGAWRWTSTSELAGVRVTRATVTRDGRATALVEIAGGRVDVEANADGVRASGEGLDLGRLPSWAEDLLPEDVPAPSAGRLAGKVVYPWAEEPAGELPGRTFELELEGLVWRGERIQKAALAGGWVGDDRVSVRVADVVGDGVHVRARQVELDLARPMLLRSAREIAIDVDSLRRFVPELERDASVSLRATSRMPEQLDIERLLLQGGEARLLAAGVVYVPAEAEAWRETFVDLRLTGQIADPAPLSLPWSGSVEVGGTLKGALEALALDVSFEGEEIRVDDRPVDSALLQAMIRWPEAEVATLEIRAPGVVVQAGGHVSLETFRVGDVTWQVAVDDLARVAPLLPMEMPALAGRLRSQGIYREEGRTLAGSADLSTEDLVVDGEEIGRVQATLRADGEGGIEVAALEVEGPRGSLQGSATADFEARTASVVALRYEQGETQASLRRPLRVSWDADVHAVRLQEADVRVDGARIRFDAVVEFESGRADVEVLVVERDGRTARLLSPLSVTWSDPTMAIESLDLEVDDEITIRAALSADVDAEIAVIERLVVHGPDVEARLLRPLRIDRSEGSIRVRDLEALVSGARVSGAADVRPEEATAVLLGLHVVKDDLDARLASPALVTWDDDGVSATDLDVTLFGGRVRGDVAWDGALRADVEAGDFALERWVGALTGEARARIRVDGDRVDVHAEVPDLAFGAWRGSAVVEATQKESGPLRVERIEVRGPNGRTLGGAARFPFRITQDGLVDLEGVEPELTLTGALGGVDRFTDVADGPITLRLTGDAEGLDVRLQLADVGLCDETRACDDVGLDVRVTHDAVMGRIALASDEFLRVRGRLSLDRGFDWTRPETLADLVESARIDAEVDVLVESWAPLARVAPDLLRLEGGTRLTFSAKGPLRAPSLEGILTLSKVGIELDTDVAPFEQVDARFVWRGETVCVERLEGLMGYAPFSIRGDVTLAADSLPVLDLVVQGRNTQLIRTEWFRMRIDVDGRVTGPVDHMHVEGEGRVVDAIFREPMSLTGAAGSGEQLELLLFSIDEQPFSQMTFDLGVRADDTIRVRNNLMKINVSYQGRLKGTGARPALEGRAFFRGAEFDLPLTTLRNGTGEIEFLPGSPGRPRIQMSAHTRTKGYEMGVQLAGRLPDVNLHVFTEPRLDDEDAVLLLATGSTGAELAEGGIAGKSLSAVASVFGGSLFSSGGDEGEPGKKSFFERFEISADVDGTDVREVDAEFEVAERLYLHVQRDRFQATNLGLIWRIRFR